MVKKVINEVMMDIRTFFKGWKLMILLLFIGISIILNISEGESEVGFLMNVFIIWTTVTMSPRINKLYYLLPGERQGRVKYILIKCLGIFIFNLAWYFVFLSISVLISNYRYRDEYQHMFCEVIPFLISYIALGMNNGYNNIFIKNNEWMKKNKFKYGVSLVLAFIPIFFSMYGLSDLFKGNWYIGMTIVSYLCSFIILFWQISICRHSDTGYENIRKFEKLFN